MLAKYNNFVVQTRGPELGNLGDKQ